MNMVYDMENAVYHQEKPDWYGAASLDASLALPQPLEASQWLVYRQLVNDDTRKNIIQAHSSSRRDGS